MKSITPIFIFSMPRSGSTLLQKMLMTNSEIASTAEPWLLLPLAAMQENDNIHAYANYSQWHTRLALSELILHLPEQEASFHQGIHDTSQLLFQDKENFQHQPAG